MTPSEPENRLRVVSLDADFGDALRGREREGIFLLPVAAGERLDGVVERIGAFATELLAGEYPALELRGYVRKLAAEWRSKALAAHGCRYKYFNDGNGRYEKMHTVLSRDCCVAIIRQDLPFSS